MEKNPKYWMGNVWLNLYPACVKVETAEVVMDHLRIRGYKGDSESKPVSVWLVKSSILLLKNPARQPVCIQITQAE